jgi:hypothetical protein
MAKSLGQPESIWVTVHGPPVLPGFFSQTMLRE